MEPFTVDLTRPALHLPFVLAGLHPGEETLELYALGCLAEPECETVEVHLLVCEHCQRALAEADDYIAAMKAALAEPLPAAVPSWWARALCCLAVPRLPQITPAISLGLAALFAGVMLTGGNERRHSPIVLRAERGSPALTMARGPADQALELTVQSLQLSIDHSFHVRIVNATGRQVWTGAPKFEKEVGYLLHVPKGLGAGAYWVRLFDADGLLLQEYGLQLE
jgi:anti-sigma factor RsiW